ncbi:unnamed protein product [Blepharisma stoltei]|uniref:Uncharacterized protein n=1 Tax=Blepharisma stoltei TaxID=1481888 RepID=A0AAU9J544_9CILI|nr:unnamed protein product [Blepharisma stoltei]
MDYKKFLIRASKSERGSLSPDQCDVKDLDEDIVNCLAKIKETKENMKKLVKSIDNFSKVKSPHFTKTEKYLTGKQMIYKKKYELNDFHRIQREKYILGLIKDNDPGKKKYIYTSMLYDLDIRNALKQNKRDFGYTQRENPVIYKTSSIENFHTIPKNSPERFKHDLNDLVSKNLNKILYNYTYYNSPKQQKKIEMKKVEEGLQNNRLGPIMHLKAASMCTSPVGEKIIIRKKKKIRRFTVNIRDEVIKNNDELSNLKKQYSKLLIMKN